MISLHDVDIITGSTGPEILIQLSLREDIKPFIKSISTNRNYNQDLYQELFVRLGEMPEKELIDIYHRNTLNGYMKGILERMLSQKNGDFSKKVMVYDKRIVEAECTDEFFEQVLEELEFNNDRWHLYLDELDKAIKNLHHYNRIVLIEKMKLKTIRKVSEKLNISRAMISECLAVTYKTLKNEVNEAIRRHDNNRLN